ncbi:hypothetical protein MLD38_029685 [Melastoma candidum]|uniref:Uncharacterized protein n=1 Tax=Melastoma candidum TaxID=119954 RepID=A0ACB9N5L3_9MYRT|nr:hypothetical protein MLD38_029685 [Melastoma candidum]
MGLFSGMCSCLKRIKRAGGVVDRDYADEDESSSSGGCCGPFFDLRVLEAATNYFSDLNLLGHGGFGPVYKGLLPSGEEVAVKRLSLSSSQGLKEFATEVNLLLKIQHRNLVVLLGCCVEGPEKMLVYEYLPNKSLDRFLFDKKNTVSLDWRTRFRIITGLARGLLYLHEEAPERIIHRDIKASNILLDAQLNPKISDFGLARLFPGDDTHVNTFRISGTHGYMAPEYAIRGILSTKTDVFSFGILVLEIVSGRKNHSKELRERADLLSYTWRLFQDGKSLEVVDSSLLEYDEDAAVLCVQLGLLCCQASYSDRPDMNAVHLMLSSESFTLPKPGKPGIQGRMSHWTTTTTSAFTTSNPYDGPTTTTKLSTGSSFQEEDSRNSISASSFGEGR